MARVNHRKVKQLLNEQRSKITDRQFFTSRILAGHFEDMAMAQTRRYHYNRRVHVNLVWKPKSSLVACTDNLRIVINAGNTLVTKNRSRRGRYEIICGLFAHELGHCLYTDFLTNRTYDNFLRRNLWYPEPPRTTLPTDALNETALWTYVKGDPLRNELLRTVAHYVFNVLEDGYVESRILSMFPGTLGSCLEALRAQQFEEMLSVTQLIEKENDGEQHIFESILQIMLSYVKFGELKYGEEPLTNERIQTIFKLLPALDAAITNSSGKNRCSVVNLVLIRCWDYIEEYIEICTKRINDAATANTLAQALSELLKSNVGGSTAAEGSGNPVSESETTSPLTNADRRRKTMEQANTSSVGDEISENESSLHPASENEDDKSDEATKDGQTVSDTIVGGTNKDAKQKVSSEETGRLPFQQTDRVSSTGGSGTITHNDTYKRTHYDRAATDIERLLEKMAEKAACQQLENERVRELNDVAQNISYGNIHEGIGVTVNRIIDVDSELVEQYNAISTPLLAISKQLQKSLLQQLKDKQRGGKQNGLLMGRRLDAHTLCRNDGKVFYKNALPNETPEMAIGLLLDESGSMCSCDRCTYARAAAIILYDFCRSLQLPVMVYGHSTGSEGVDLFSYAEFESYDQDDKYRMMDIAARGSNRDGAALRFVAEQLSKRQEEIKILILVSDGQPADTGYYGTAAEEDLRGIKQEYRRKGILFIAAAIGDDKQNIERIYGDSFMDITDLTQLPMKLTTAVKRHIRA